MSDCTVPRFGTFVPAKNNCLAGFDKANERHWNGPFCFVQGTDIQLGMMGGGKPENGWQAEIDIAKKCIETINRISPKPKFMIMTGDLVDALPGNPQKPAQEKDFREVFSNLDPDIPLFCLPGNHDLGQTPTTKTIHHFVSNFGDDYFSFWTGGVKFIALNSQYLKESHEVPVLKAAHECWLYSELSHAPEENCKHIVLFQHIPWFHSSYDESEDVFNIPIDERKKWLDRVMEAGVKHAFSGHCHRNTGGSYLNGEFVMTVTSAMGAQLGNDGHGFRVIKVNENVITHQYVTCE